MVIKFLKQHIHGIIQAIVWIAFLLFCIGIISLIFQNVQITRFGYFEIYDGLFLIGMGFAVAIAFTFSHAYNYKLSNLNTMYEKAAKLQTVWLHAHYCWEVINAWMIILFFP